MKPLLVVIAAAGFAAAQTVSDTFAVIRILRKPAVSVADSESIRAHRQARVPVDVVGLTSLTGTSQVWLVEALGSFAGLEAVDRALAGITDATENELLAPTTSLIGIYRPGLSYRPEEAFKMLPSARYFQVSVFRIRPGADMDFAEVIQIRKMARDSINLDRPEIGYQIVSGASSGTYVFLAPMRSLRSFDEGFARVPVYAEAISHGGGKARQIAAEADITREHLIFRVEPRVSYVSEAFGSADAEFWLGRSGQR